jgi:hypothetical protein
MKPLAAALFPIALAVLTGSAAAQEAKIPRRVLPLESYEPNTIGFTWDSDDVRFLDAKISVKYPLMPELTCEKVSVNSRPYFAVTTRFGQYLDTRESSPVIGKRFNPKLVWRQVTKWGDPGERAEYGCALSGGRAVREYFEFAYGHESNGQSINSPEEYLVEAQKQRFENKNPAFANDFISRGWDYLEVAAKRVPVSLSNREFSVYGSFRYFIDPGLLQGPIEEYNSWEEDAEGKPRRRVHGLALLLKQENWFDWGWITGSKLVLGWETGYSSPLRYNTFRVEGGVKLWELPIMAFWQQGYGNDLAMYYKRAHSYGFALEVAGF